MIVLRVEVNGELVAEGGKDELCVLTAIVGATGVLGPKSRGTKTEKEKPDLRLNLGGLGAESDEDPGTHYDWISQEHLEIGDEVLIKVSEQSTADQAIKSHRSKPNEDLQREHWQKAKEYYFKFKEKFEE